MNAATVIAYAYSAALHCPRCASLAKKTGDDARDRDGERIAVVFADADTGADYCDSCGHAIGEAPKVCRVLSVDAWRDGDGWTWNDWRNRGFIPLAWCDLAPRALLAKLRGHGSPILNVPGPGCAAIEDDGYNLVIVYRGTREPVLALAYGEAC